MMNVAITTMEIGSIAKTNLLASGWSNLNYIFMNFGMSDL